MRITQFLMGTLVQIEVDGGGFELAVEAALEEMRRVEGLMSRFLPGSDVSRLNAACREPLTVSPETFSVVEEALLISRLSRGSFDITSASENGADYKVILLDKEAHRILLSRPGMALDLGGIAKGYAVDRAIEVLRAMGVQDALVNAGGDIRVLGGSRTLGPAWSIGVQHPRVQHGLLCEIALADNAVASSGDYYRYGLRRGRRHHHILDPRRGRSAYGSLAATVVTDRALMADALATAAFVLGPDEGIDLIDSLPGVEGLVVGADGRIYATLGLEVRLGQRSLPRVKADQASGRRLSRLGALLGTVALISAWTVSCQGGGIVPPDPALTQPVPVITTEARHLKDGTYTGESVSGVRVQVEVTVQGGRISDIQILEYREISWIHAGKPTDGEVKSWQDRREDVLRWIPTRIIEKQSTSVDAVTGATLSSNTIMAAVEAALTNAVSQSVR